jgi:alpha-ketoglutarate-dependent taurine dioxygenase
MEHLKSLGENTTEIQGYVITLFNEPLASKKLEQKRKARFEGRSPYATKYKEGPSYITNFPAPLSVSGKLDQDYEYFEVNPNVGREYPTAQLSDIINDEELLYDLAVTVARRGVCFFRDQKLSLEEQKILIEQLGKLTNKPETSNLYIHPSAVSCGVVVDGEIDPEILALTSRWTRVYSGKGFAHPRDDAGWHSDNAGETIPASFCALRIVETPPGAGGDTMWASACGLYDKLSPSLRAYLETLTATFSQDQMTAALREAEVDYFFGPRGAPENIGDGLRSVHPAIRTNPVTGWNSVYGLGTSFQHFNELASDESKMLNQYLTDLLLRSPELQIRFRWNPNDIAVWDNHSVFHAATKCNITDTAHRTGLRTTGVGERPYLSECGKSRAQDLKETGLSW